MRSRRHRPKPTRRRPSGPSHGHRAAGSGNGRKSQRYREQLIEAILAYLAFASEHAALAQQIAEDAAARAAVVGSGRVGRTRTISLEDRAALAARASIRHQHTSYEDELDRLAFLEGWDADYLYRDIKSAAHAAVDEFIDAHR